MERHLGQSERADDAILLISATEHGGRSLSPTGRSEWRTGRQVVVGALAITFGALALGLVFASRTQPAGAVRTDVLPAAPSPTPRSSLQRPKPAPQATRQTLSAQFPLAFTGNREQLYPVVGYYLQKQGTTLYFTPQGFTLILAEPTPASGMIQKTLWNRESISKESVPASTRRLVTLAFVGANPEVHPQWQEPTSAAMRTATDSQLQEKTGHPVSATLHYRNVWPGIDLLYTIAGDRLRSTFVVQPGADPNQIQFAYYGITAITRAETGRLEVGTPVGSFAEELPVAYQESHYLAQLARLRDSASGTMSVTPQERNGQRVAVAVTYTLQSSEDTAVWGIHVGTYDPHTPLIIERIVRYPGSSGGGDPNVASGVPVDRDGITYADASSAPLNPSFP